MEKIIIDKYSSSALMQILGNMSIQDLNEASEGRFKEDIVEVVIANGYKPENGTLSLATDLVLLGMMYGYKHLEM